ncbi:hypothetical protein ACSFA0_24585 [Variovorax sp. LT1P1]|uniref:hypothetical protein n=1 Tax=Variovorax sp. LT1P1 TaxID=3443730 RepID=UPI003F45E6D2
MTDEDTPQWREELLQKIGCYGVSDLRLLNIAASICAHEPLTDEQKRYARSFEARLGDWPSVRGNLA